MQNQKAGGGVGRVSEVAACRFQGCQKADRDGTRAHSRYLEVTPMRHFHSQAPDLSWRPRKGGEATIMITIEISPNALGLYSDPQPSTSRWNGNKEGVCPCSYNHKNKKSTSIWPSVPRMPRFLHRPVSATCKRMYPDMFVPLRRGIILLVVCK